MGEDCIGHGWGREEGVDVTGCGVEETHFEA